MFLQLVLQELTDFRLSNVTTVPQRARAAATVSARWAAEKASIECADHVDHH
ncbi:hypothetical protein [Streptomyces sp. NPDC005486]|uniref:hypothetical protein n=1 Tax=Streptomyces sp. NPDC005486 TaxID=3155345 RepID=UPI0033B609C7